MTPERPHALALLSGSLDSQLAACLLREQGVAVHGLFFSSPFIRSERALEAGAQLDFPVEEIDFTKRMVDVVQRCPALDDVDALTLECHAEMLRCAVEKLEEFNCGFVCTGEVLNQGSSTQTEEGLRYTAECSGAADRILRPLSARCFPETMPELEHWVSRDQLEAIDGADNRRQHELAGRFGVDAGTPDAGESRLHDSVFTDRLADLRVHEGLEGRRALELLGLGHHFRLGPVTKLVLGRTQEEKAELEGNVELYDLILHSDEIPGPIGLLPIIATEDQVRFAASICARFSDVATDGTAPILIRSSRSTRQVEVRPAAQEEVARVEI